MVTGRLKYIFGTCDQYFTANNGKMERKRIISLEEGQSQEVDVFANKSWILATSGLKNEQIGMDALRAGFRKVFRDQVRAQIPKIIQRGNRRLAGIQSAYDASKKHTVQKQRMLLRSIVSNYQMLVDSCLAEDFSELKEGDVLCLPVRLAVCKEVHLCRTLASKGERRKFGVTTEIQDLESDHAASARCSKDLNKETNIYTWINERYQSTNTSSIPGLVPYPLVEKLFKEQTAPWAARTDEFTATNDADTQGSNEGMLKKWL